MLNPIETLKKIKDKGWTEIRALGKQAISGSGGQIESSDKLPSDEEFLKLLDESKFSGENISAEVLFERFYAHSASSFFQSFRQKEETLRTFRHDFGEKSARVFIEKAKRTVEGRFASPGFEKPDFGVAVDWHSAPVSEKRAAPERRKPFVNEPSREIDDPQIVREINCRQHFFTLGVAFWLTGDERFARAFARRLDGWMEENPPGAETNPASGRAVALRSISWIWAFHFFEHSAAFTPELFRKALKFLYLDGRRIEKNLTACDNPNMDSAGEALGLFYLGTQLPFFERAARWRKESKEILLAELDRRILSDGVYFEQSTGRQRSAADFYAQFFILQKLNGGDLPEKLAGKIQSALDFLLAITRPDGTTPLVGKDSGEAATERLPYSNAAANDFRAALSTGATIFGRGDYKFVAGEFAEETLWLLGAQGKADFEKLPAQEPVGNSFAFKEGGYFVMRDGWTDGDNFLLVGGGNSGALSIDAAIGGKTFLVDAENGGGDEPDAARNNFLTTGARNTLTVNEKNVPSETNAESNRRSEAETRSRRWISQDRFDFFEESRAAGERLENAFALHTRGILFLKNDFWIMRDFVETRDARDYALNFHFDAATSPQIVTALNGGLCIDEKSYSNSGWRLFTFGDNGEWRRGGAAAIAALGDDGRNSDAPFFKFASSGAGAQEFFTFALPREAQFDAPDVFETEVVGGRAFVVKYRDYRDLCVFADGGGGQIVRTEFFDTDFRFLWARLSAGEDLPEELVLVGGTHFSFSGAQIVDSAQRETEFVIARRLGERLNVCTPDGIFSLSLPQRKTATDVLKNKE